MTFLPGNLGFLLSQEPFPVEFGLSPCLVSKCRCKEQDEDQLVMRTQAYSQIGGKSECSSVEPQSFSLRFCHSCWISGAGLINALHQGQVTPAARESQRTKEDHKL